MEHEHCLPCRSRCQCTQHPSHPLHDTCGDALVNSGPWVGASVALLVRCMSAAARWWLHVEAYACTHKMCMSDGCHWQLASRSFILDICWLPPPLHTCQHHCHLSTTMHPQSGIHIHTCSEPGLTLATVTVAPARLSTSMVMTASISSLPSATGTSTVFSPLPAAADTAIARLLDGRCGADASRPTGAFVINGRGLRHLATAGEAMQSMAAMAPAGTFHVDVICHPYHHTCLQLSLQLAPGSNYSAAITIQLS